MERAKKVLPKGNNFGPKTAKIGIIGFGSTYGPIMESMEQMEEKGLEVRFHQIRTISPLLEDDPMTLSIVWTRFSWWKTTIRDKSAELIQANFGEFSEKIESITKFDEPAPSSQGNYRSNSLGDESRGECVIMTKTVPVSTPIWCPGAGILVFSLRRRKPLLTSELNQKIR